MNPPIPDDPLVDEKGMAVISDDSPTASWKDKLLGNLDSNVNSQKEEDFNLTEGDAAKEVVDVRFQDDNEYLTAILGGLWTIFGHYLMVRPWTPGFSTDQAQPSNLMVWIRLPGLPEGMYTTSLLKFIGGTVGPITKIDRNTDNRARGQFTHLMVFVDLGQPLVSDKDRWKDSIARVRASTNESDQPQRRVFGVQKNVEEDRYIPWMLVEQKQRRGPSPVEAKSVGVTAAGETSCFRIFGGNLVDATGINAQESNVDDMSQTVTTQSKG
ncbi:hypothetical protein Golob_000884, partial [Gossypium lobatum]|nr:hypothetical protein [Gossypium lobatum]